MFPFLLISSTDPRSSLTLWNTNASHTPMLPNVIGPGISIPSYPDGAD